MFVLLLTKYQLVASLYCFGFNI